MKGEVIIKWFYFYYFWFHQPNAPAQSISNAAETFNVFFSRIFWFGKIWKRFCVLKFSKIRKKVFFSKIWIGGWTKLKKRIYFRTLRHSSFRLPSVMDFFHGESCFLAHPIVHSTVFLLYTIKVDLNPGTKMHVFLGSGKVYIFKLFRSDCIIVYQYFYKNKIHIEYFLRLCLLTLNWE